MTLLLGNAERWGEPWKDIKRTIRTSKTENFGSGLAFEAICLKGTRMRVFFLVYMCVAHSNYWEKLLMMSFHHTNKNILLHNYTQYIYFVCVDVLRPCQQLRSCRAGQLPINIVPGQA